MKLYRLNELSRYRIGIAEAWRFFSSPANLPLITPKEIRLEVRGELPENVYAGMLITYRVRPLLSIPVSWVTEITQVNEPHSFVDEQRFGPYAFWHHQHFFREIGDEVEVEDLVHYGLPLGACGRLFGGAFVQRKLKEVFDYRRVALGRIFSGIRPASPSL